MGFISIKFCDGCGAENVAVSRVGVGMSMFSSIPAQSKELCDECFTTRPFSEFFHTEAAYADKHPMSVSTPDKAVTKHG